MSEEIHTGAKVGGTGGPTGQATRARSLFPMHVGNTIIYIESTSATAVIEDGTIRPVSSFEPTEAFAEACNFIRESFRGIGQRLSDLEVGRPKKLEIEFTIDFELAGKARIIPILVTGETKAQAGIKVKAVWENETSPPFALNQADLSDAAAETE